jgi:hypothetical protein
MRSRTVRIGAVAAALCLAAGLTTLQAPAASAQTTALSTRCTTAQHYQACSTVDARIPVSFQVGYRDSIRNDLDNTATGKCESNTSKTVKFGVTAGIKVEMKAAIFASMEASLSANIETSMVTGYVTSATFTIKPHKTIYCDRGIVQENVKGRSVLHWYGGGAGTIRQTYVAHAPSRAQWRIYY